MKVEHVADSAEANPFPCKALPQNRWRAKAVIAQNCPAWPPNRERPQQWCTGKNMNPECEDTTRSTQCPSPTRGSNKDCENSNWDDAQKHSFLAIQLTRRASEQQTQKTSEQPISEPYKRVKHTSSAAHPLHHKMCNLATLGFPAPDADHQKHISSFGEALNMARLYIATWLQAV